MNASFGACEATPLTSQTGRGPLSVAIGNNIQDSVEKSLRQAFTEGRTVFAAAGDSGSSCAAVSLPVVGGGNGVANQVYPAQLYPAASPYVTAVGGTVVDLNPDGSRKKEETWAFTGGGSALFIPEPEWQKGGGRTSTGRACSPTPTAVPQPPRHDLPWCPGHRRDVRQQPAEAIYIVNYDQPTGAGGTSLSSPLVMGAWSRVAAAARTRIGRVAPAIYRLDADAAGPATSSTSPPGEAIGNGLNVPGPGWDYTSGYGVPDIAHLAADLGGGIVPVQHPKHPAKVPDPQTGTVAGNGIACLPFGTSPGRQHRAVHVRRSRHHPRHHLGRDGPHSRRAVAGDHRARPAVGSPDRARLGQHHRFGRLDLPGADLGGGDRSTVLSARSAGTIRTVARPAPTPSRPGPAPSAPRSRPGTRGTR